MNILRANDNFGIFFDSPPKIFTFHLRKIKTEVGIWRASRERMMKTRSTATVREDSFIEMTDEAKYWLGFMMADGSVSATTNEMRLKLKSEDHQHIKSFCVYLGLPLSRARRGKDGSRVTFSSPEIKRFLISKGITPRKSYTAKVLCDELRVSRHFWCGYIDGDGSIFSRTMDTTDDLYGLSAVSGSRDLIWQFQQFVSNELQMDQEIQIVVKKKLNYTIYFSGKRAAAVIQLLYSKMTFALIRKYYLAHKAVLRCGYTLDGDPVNFKTETGEKYIRIEKNPKLKNRFYRVLGLNEINIGSFSNLEIAKSARDYYFLQTESGLSPEEAKDATLSKYREYFPKPEFRAETPQSLQMLRRKTSMYQGVSLDHLGKYFGKITYQSRVTGKKGREVYITRDASERYVCAVTNIVYHLRDAGIEIAGKRQRLNNDQYDQTHFLPHGWKAALLAGGVSEQKCYELEQELRSAYLAR